MPNQILLPLTALSLLLGCGSSPLTKSKVATTQASTASLDATGNPAKDQDQALLASLDTPAEDQCHQSGMVWVRRLAACSVNLHLSTFDCTRSGITAAFAPTGYQIVQALAQALGAAASDTDMGDGFALDECGESASGEVYVELVGKSPAAQEAVREFEAGP